MSAEQHDEQQEGVTSGNNALETAEAMPVEATWDSDNDYLLVLARIDNTSELHVSKIGGLSEQNR
jgi:hypothetical protein